MDGELLGTDNVLLECNNGNAVGSDDGSDDGVDDDTALSILVCRDEGIDDSDGVESICSVVFVWRTRLELVVRQAGFWLNLERGDTLRTDER